MKLVRPRCNYKHLINICIDIECNEILNEFVTRCVILNEFYTTKDLVRDIERHVCVWDKDTRDLLWVT